MSRQLLIPVGCLFLGLVSGIGFGLFMGSAPSPVEAPEKSTTLSSSAGASGMAAQNENQADSLLNIRIRDLEEELSDEKKNRDAVIHADQLTFFKKYHDRMILQAFDGNLKVTPEMADILGLSKEEQQVLEQHLAETKTEMDKLEETKIVLVKQAADSVTLEVPVAPEGKALKDKLNSLVSGDIGEDRAELLMNSGGYAFNGPFSGFAEQKREIKIKWADQNGSPLYTIKDSSIGPNGPSWTTSSSTSLPPQYERFLQIEPGP